MGKSRRYSSENILEYKQTELILNKCSPDKPVHKMVESFLSTESGFTNFRGFVNLGMIMLLIFGGRMALQNFHSNGIIMDPFVWRYILTGEHAHPPGIAFIACGNIFILIGYFIEKVLTRISLPKWMVLFLVMSNLISCILFPTVVVLLNDWSPFFSSPVLSMYVIIFLKLWSYAMVNNWCRNARLANKDVCSNVFKELAEIDAELDSPFSTGGKNKRSKIVEGEARRHISMNSCGEEKKINRHVSVSGNASPLNPLPEDEIMNSIYEGLKDSLTKGMIIYPNNVTLCDIYYFMCAPTLCYELNFPRIFSIRKRFLFKRLLELICLLQVIVCLVQQWIVPNLKNSVAPFIQSHWFYVVECLMMIAIPNNIIWLLCFYALFHSFLNVVAEVFRFGDRFFYGAWWNSSSITGFWSSWNIPVHRWCHRHLYTPLLSGGVSKFPAAALVFLLSAFFHELLVSVPLKMLRYWAFMGMLFQQPYAYLVYRYCRKGEQLGNMAMWLSLIIGQPLALYMYFHDYYLMHNT